MTSTPLGPDSYLVDAAGFAGIRGLARRAVSRKAREAHRYGLSRMTVGGFQAVKAAGYDGVSLYLGGNFGVSKATVEAAWSAGLVVMMNWERSSSGGLGGATFGANAATSAVQGAEALGMLPTDGNIIFSFVDFGPTAAQIAICLACDHAMVDNMVRLGWTGGSYGPKAYLDQLAVQPWWPQEWPLWHWAGDHAIPQSWTTVQQLLAPTHDVSHIPVAVDENRVYRPLQCWTGYGADPIEPQENDMTPDELHAIVDPQFKAIWDVLTLPGPAGLSMQWSVFDVQDFMKKWLPGQVAAAVVAALPPAAAGGLTKQDMIDAFAAVLADMTIEQNAPPPSYFFKRA